MNKYIVRYKVNKYCTYKHGFDEVLEENHCTKLEEAREFAEQVKRHIGERFQCSEFVLDWASSGYIVSFEGIYEIFGKRIE